MDDRYHKEEFTETKYPRRERSSVDGGNRYPVRGERRTLSFQSEQTRMPEKEEMKQSASDWDRFLDETTQSKAQEESVKEPIEMYNRNKRKKRKGRAGRSRTQKKKMKGSVKVVIVLLIALIMGGGMFFMMNRLMNPPVEELELSGTEVTVTIPEGAGTEEIAHILKDNDLINSVLGFRVTSKINGFDGTYKQGKYNVDTGMTKLQIMELLQSGKVVQDIQLMIPEGYTVAQIAAKVEETGICSAEEFINTCNETAFEYDFLKDLPDREYKLEGYLFPDTYFFSEDSTVVEVVNAMLKRFDQMYTEEYRNAVSSSGYTLDEIVTLASMIEKEIKLPEERAKAAGVMYNRLEDGITLGIDATVLYAVGKTGGTITQDDLNVDSPYNTRKNFGLPLGPISSPGEVSFKAAIYPERHNYLYYVVEEVGKDNHVYCETYDEFLNAKAAYNASAR